LRAIWLTRNDMVFHKQDWKGVKVVIRKVLRLSLEWKLLCKEQDSEMMGELVFVRGETDKRSSEDPVLMKVQLEGMSDKPTRPEVQIQV
jgi:hypothetical protein